MRKRKWRIAVVLLFLYLLTWVGGWLTHARELEARAHRYWNEAAARDREMEQFAAAEGLPRPTGRIPHLREGGPVTHVDWCFPLLPGILVADSWYVVGPLYGKGGVKLVVYYGVGSVELVTLVGWIS
jgi:hypothetical protein